MLPYTEMCRVVKVSHSSSHQVNTSFTYNMHSSSRYKESIKRHIVLKHQLSKLIFYIFKNLYVI